MPEVEIKIFDTLIHNLKIVNLAIERASKFIDAYNSLSFKSLFRQRKMTKRRKWIREYQRYNSFICINASLLSTAEVYLRGI